MLDVRAEGDPYPASRKLKLELQTTSYIPRLDRHSPQGEGWFHILQSETIPHPKILLVN